LSSSFLPLSFPSRDVDYPSPNYYVLDWKKSFGYLFLLFFLSLSPPPLHYLPQNRTAKDDACHHSPLRLGFPSPLSYLLPPLLPYRQRLPKKSENLQKANAGLLPSGVMVPPFHLTPSFIMPRAMASPPLPPFSPSPFFPPLGGFP